jgi:hypothetical protein
MKSHILKLMEMEMILDCQCMAANYLFNNFKYTNFLTSWDCSSLLMWSNVKPKPLNCLHIIFLWWFTWKGKTSKIKIWNSSHSILCIKLIKHTRSNPLLAQKNDVQLISRYVIILNLDGNFLTILNWSKKTSKKFRMCMTIFLNW